MSSPFGEIKRRPGIRERYEEDDCSPVLSRRNHARSTSRELEESCYASFKSDAKQSFESDESSEEQYNDSHTNTFERSKSVPRSPKPSKESTKSKRQPKANESFNNINNATQGSSFGVTCLKFIIVSGLILLASSMVYANLLSPEPTNKNIRCGFEELKRLYPDQDERLWRPLQNGIENILKELSHSPGVYLLFYHKQSEKIKNLVLDIGKRTNECFGNASEIIELKAEDFMEENALQDYGVIIEKYQQKLSKGRVALIANLNEIPPESARALHSICDTVNPLAPDVVVYLTLQVPTEMGSSPKVAYEQLLDLWSPKLNDNELGPLVTRVADSPLFLKSE